MTNILLDQQRAVASLRIKIRELEAQLRERDVALGKAEAAIRGLYRPIRSERSLRFARKALAHINKVKPI